VIVRWGLAELGGVLRELGIEAPALVTSRRFADLVELATAGVWLEVPSDRIALPAAADGVLAIGGGSAIDTAKAASAAANLPLVSVPTTYAGAEWTSFFGVRSSDRRLQGGGAGAHPAGIVYEPALTLGLPRAETVGTALNALAHAAEALYSTRPSAQADRCALEGARLIAAALPRVVAAPDDLAAREQLLRGAAAAGEALALAGLALAHALAQALGGRYGLPHGAMNALTLPPALRFNARLAPAAVERFGEAIGNPGDPAARVEELARLGGFHRLADFGIPEVELAEVAAAAAARAGNAANPRPATVAEIETLLQSIY
jgi:maleylacetate reductase